MRNGPDCWKRDTLQECSSGRLGWIVHFPGRNTCRWSKAAHFPFSEARATPDNPPVVVCRGILWSWRPSACFYPSAPTSATHASQNSSKLPACQVDKARLGGCLQCFACGKERQAGSPPSHPWAVLRQVKVFGWVGVSVDFYDFGVGFHFPCVYCEHPGRK